MIALLQQESNYLGARLGNGDAFTQEKRNEYYYFLRITYDDHVEIPVVQNLNDILTTCQNSNEYQITHNPTVNAINAFQAEFGNNAISRNDYTDLEEALLTYFFTVETTRRFRKNVEKKLVKEMLKIKLKYNLSGVNTLLAGDGDNVDNLRQNLTYALLVNRVSGNEIVMRCCSNQARIGNFDWLGVNNNLLNQVRGWTNNCDTNPTANGGKWREVYVGVFKYGDLYRPYVGKATHTNRHASKGRWGEYGVYHLKTTHKAHEEGLMFKTDFLPDMYLLYLGVQNCCIFVVENDIHGQLNARETHYRGRIANANNPNLSLDMGC